MAYSNTWDVSFESSPAGATGNVADGDDRIRELKLAIRERMQKDHYFDPSGTDADHGEHKKVTLRVCSTPGNVTDKGFLYAKDYNSKAELHYLDEDGNEVLLTKSGSVASAFLSGTKMLFYQDTAPTGWTIENTLNDKLVFVSKGSAAGGQEGGTAHSSGTWTQPSHYHTQPEHQHLAPVGVSGSNICWNNSPPWGSGTSFSYNQRHDYNVNGTATYMKVKAGGGDNTGSSATTNTWRPAAYVCIICTKD